MKADEIILRLGAFLESLKDDQKEELICAGCGVAHYLEPTVKQRCCRVACNDCHTKCLVKGKPMVRCIN